MALAYCSGYYKNKLQAKSLLNGQEGYSTLQMVANSGYLEFRNAYGILRKYWEPRVADNLKNMKSFRDESGVVFDIKSDHLDSFMDNFDRLKQTEKIDFTVTKCTQIPDLEDDPGYGNSN